MYEPLWPVHSALHPQKCIIAAVVVVRSDLEDPIILTDNISRLSESRPNIGGTFHGFLSIPDARASANPTTVYLTRSNNHLSASQ